MKGIIFFILLILLAGIYSDSLFAQNLILNYSTYLGGSDNDKGNQIAIDLDYCAYIIGSTASINFPTVNPYKAIYNGGNRDVFITKLSSLGSFLIYSTYLGGQYDDLGMGIATDLNNCAFITGLTESTNFPTKNAYQTTFSGTPDWISCGFVSKLASSGSELIYSTYLGGSNYDENNDIAIDSTFCSYVIGATESSDFPTQNPYQHTLSGGADNFITKFSSSGSSLIYSTYLGGSGLDGGNSITLDSTNSAFVITTTSSFDFPTHNPYQSTHAGGLFDICVAKLSPSGSSLIYSTYLGGDSYDYDSGISIDLNNCAYVTGQTASSDFPTINAYQPSMGGGSYDIFITKFSSSGSSLVYSTYLGGRDSENIGGIAVDSYNCSYISGDTNSSDFPTYNPYQSTHAGGLSDMCVAKFSPSGSSLIYSTYLGGQDAEITGGITIDITNNPYITGCTYSLDFPTQNPFQASHNGGYLDAFVSKFNLVTPTITTTPTPILTPSPTFTPTSTPTLTPTPTIIPTPTPTTTATITPTPTATPTSIPTPTPIRLVIDSGDYDGDGTSDIAIFRSTSGLWAVRGITQTYFGQFRDLPASGDYDGDGTTDMAIFRATSGLWAIRGVTQVYFGISGDNPVPSDYDGDNDSDIAIFRDSTGLWAIKDLTRVYLGSSSDAPVPGDYDGDGTDDIGFFRDSTGLWRIRNVTEFYYGTSNDKAVPGDYNQSGYWEVGIFRPSSGLWAIRNVTRVYFGASTDLPIPADYDGDSDDNITIFRDSSGLWVIRSLTRVYFGMTGDLPVTR